jgi:UDP-2-acetamido-2-deoxy-ribo-hexuluronate aminotransferase
MTTTQLKKIEFIDLKAQQERIRESVDERISRVLDHGIYIMGPEITELEEKLAEYTGAKHCISCANGTDALMMALMAYDVKPGDIVFTTPFTFFATAEVIALLGAIPVFVDIDEKTFNIDAGKLRTTIEEVLKNNDVAKLRGIIPVDLFGQAADYDEINAIAKEFNLFVLEDAAQSFGASYKGRKAGSLAEIATTSFFPAKPLGCYGDGGAIFCESDEIAAKLRSIRVHGQGSDKYNNVRIGLNGRLDTIQAAVLLAKLEIFDEEIALRNDVANYYSELLKDFVITPFIKEHNISAWAQYSVISPERDKLMDKLKSAGIPSVIYYVKPLHLQDAFSYLGFKKGDFPISESIAETIFSLPMHPYLQREEQDVIADTLKF